MIEPLILFGLGMSRMGGCIVYAALHAQRWADERSAQFLRDLLAKDREFHDPGAQFSTRASDKITAALPLGYVGQCSSNEPPTSSRQPSREVTHRPVCLTANRSRVGSAFIPRLILSRALRRCS